MSSIRVMTGPRRVHWAAGLLVLMCGVVFGQTSAGPGPAMTNQDVIKMTSLGFGNDVIQAKINQAPAVNFKLEVEDLSYLKSAGVSQSVISTMLKRSTGGGPPMGGPGPPPGARPMGAYPYGGPNMPDNGVRLLANGHDDVVLRGIAGTMSTTFAYVTTLIYANFPGEMADTRIHDRRPTLVIISRDSPKGRFFLVSAEIDSKNGVRSVKMGNSHFFGASNLGAPDSDNQIPYDAVPVEGTNTWRLTPTKDLRPGEYGLWRSMGEMYDFGVDP